MARLGSINNNNRRKELSVTYAKKRQALKDIIMDRSLPLAQRFAASVKLSELPRNSAPIRFRRRCAATGRPRGVYRFCGLGRIALREMAVQGLMPGMRRSSW